MPINTGGFPIDFGTGAYAQFLYDAYAELLLSRTPLYEQFCTVYSPSQVRQEGQFMETYDVHPGLPSVTDELVNFPEVLPLQGRQRTWTFKKIADALRVSDEAQRYGTTRARLWEKVTVDAPNAFLMKINKIAVDYLNRSGETFMVDGVWTTLGFDAQPLFSAAHPSLVGANRTNLATGAGTTLTEAHLGTAIQLFSEQLDETGEMRGVPPTVLYVCPTLEQTGAAILGSVMTTDATAAVGRINTLSQSRTGMRLQVIPGWSRFNGLASTTHWAVGVDQGNDLRLMKQSDLIIKERMNEANASTGLFYHQYIGVGHGRWEGWYGFAGA